MAEGSGETEVVSVRGLDLPRPAFELALALEVRGATFRVTDGKLLISGVKPTAEEMAALKVWKPHVIAMVEYKAPDVVVDEVGR